MKALLFPGQGSQIVGMGSDFFNKFSLVKKIFEEADDILKFKISKLILEGPKDKLQLTQITQPAILTVSYSIFKILEEEAEFDQKEFKYFAGHSLGEYSALVCAKSLNFKDGLFLLNERGKAMQEAVPVGDGLMVAVLGSDIDTMEDLLKNNITSGICEIANDNSDAQIIISGDAKTVTIFQEILKTKKIKSILLPVSAPFHCSLMKPAADNFKKKIEKIKFDIPKIDVLSNVTGKPENDPISIKNLLIKQIYSKVRWRESILHMKQNNINKFIEIGPGKILSGLLKRMLKLDSFTNVNTTEDIKNINK